MSRRSSHPAQEIRVESRRAAEEMSALIRKAHAQSLLVTFAGALAGSVLFHVVVAALR